LKYPDIKMSISYRKNASEIFKLIGERQNLMKDAWLASTGHKRPEMKKGLPMPEAKKRYWQIEERLDGLVK